MPLEPTAQPSPPPSPPPPPLAPASRLAPGPLPAGGLPQLEGDPEATVRFPVCIALREIGFDVIAAVPALREALDDRNDDVAAMARKVLIKVTGEDPRPFGEND